MKKLKLNQKEIKLFNNFLNWATKKEPEYFMDWEEQYMLLSKIKKEIKKYINHDIITCSKNEAWAIQNCFQLYVNEIYEKRLGKQLFYEARNLFVKINNDLWESIHNPFIFIENQYEIKQKEKILINPYDKPEKYIDNTKKINNREILQNTDLTRPYQPY